MAGKMVHFELPSGDAERAKAFWSGVFGWEFSDPMGVQYWLTRSAEGEGGAIFTASDDARGLKVYFDTEDIDATMTKIREAGGSASDKLPIPGTGWFSAGTDSEGNDFGVFESDESVTV